MLVRLQHHSVNSFLGKKMRLLKRHKDLYDTLFFTHPLKSFSDYCAQHSLAVCSSHGATRSRRTDKQVTGPDRTIFGAYFAWNDTYDR